MKNIIILVLISSFLNATVDTNATSLDMFLFKIGFKAMASDLDVQKKLSTNNSQRIKQLEEKIQKLLDINKKYKIKNTNLLEIVNTKQKIQIIKQTEILKYKIAVVATKETKIQEEAKSQSKVIRVAKKHDILKIEYCVKFGWCKLYKQKAYVAKYRIKF